MRVKTFTDVGIRADAIVDPKGHHPQVEADEDEVVEWELFSGPRFRFGLLLGESSIWSGPPRAVDGDALQRCRFCGRPIVVARIRARLKDGERLDTRVARPAPVPCKPLESHVYCLGCDRSGRDSEIRAADVKPAEPRRAYTPDPVLKGGQD